jgi:acyl dehydratase
MNTVQQPVEWSIKAQNLPEHARNPIHTDAGAQAAGFPRALVAGVTTYAYLTHPLIVAWGEDWLARGGGEIRFRRPVFDHDVLRCVPVIDGDAVLVQAITSEPEQPRAIFRAVRDGGAVAPLREGEVLPSKEFQLIDTFSCDYGSRAGDDLSFFADRGLVHPAVWPALANDIVYNYVARGSWVHMRSIIRHHATAPVGATAELRSVVVKRFESHGERAVLDVHIVVDGQVVASLEHEAIVALP